MRWGPARPGARHRSGPMPGQGRPRVSSASSSTSMGVNSYASARICTVRGSSSAGVDPLLRTRRRRAASCSRRSFQTMGELPDRRPCSGGGRATPKHVHGIAARSRVRTRMREQSDAGAVAGADTVARGGHRPLLRMGVQERLRVRTQHLSVRLGGTGSGSEVGRRGPPGGESARGERWLVSQAAWRSSPWRPWPMRLSRTSPLSTSNRSRCWVVNWYAR